LNKRCPDCDALLQAKHISQNECWKCGSTSISESIKIEAERLELEKVKTEIDSSSLSKNKARNTLKEAKENLDLELITQNEYDKLKEELKPIILGNGEDSNNQQPKKNLSAKELKKFIPPDGIVLEIRKQGRYIKAFDVNGVDLSGWISSSTRNSAFAKNKNLKLKMVGGSSTGWTWRQVSKETKISKIDFKNIKSKLDSDQKTYPVWVQNIIAAFCIFVFAMIMYYRISPSEKYTSTELNTMLKDKNKSEVKSIIGNPYRGGKIWTYRKLAWDEDSKKYLDCFVHFYPYNCSEPACWVDEIRCY